MVVAHLMEGLQAEKGKGAIGCRHQVADCLLAIFDEHRQERPRACVISETGQTVQRIPEAARPQQAVAQLVAVGQLDLVRCDE